MSKVIKAEPMHAQAARALSGSDGMTRRRLALWMGLIGCIACHEVGREGVDEAVVDEAAPDDPDAAPLAAVADGRGAGSVIAEPQDAARTVFDPGVVRTYELTIDSASLSKMNRMPSAEVEVPAQLRVDGQTYRVTARYKGAVGSFMAPCTDNHQPTRSTGPKVGKCSLKIDFNAIDADQRFHGLKKLNLHAMGQDPSMMKERLGYWLFRQMGIAAPRAMHARVVINGRLEGVFLAVEQVDGRFSKSRFSDGGNGNVYKEVWPTSDSAQHYQDALETNKGSGANVAKMLAFKRAIDQGSGAALAWLDTTYMMRYLAVDRVIMNDDGVMHWYCGSNHNYYWYESDRADRMWLVPWDLDSSFASSANGVHIDQPWYRSTNACSCNAGGQRAASCDRLTRYLADLRSQYEAQVDAFLAGPFASSNVDAALSTWVRQVTPLVDEARGVLGASDRNTWLQKVDGLRSAISSARRYRGFDYGSHNMSPSGAPRNGGAPPRQDDRRPR